MSKLSRRDFLKLGGLSLGGLAFSPSLQNLFDFDDSNLVRVATESVSVYKRPSDESSIVSTWFRDELLHVYGEVEADEPTHNPIWYRVWGGYIHRARLQRVKVLGGNGIKLVVVALGTGGRKAEKPTCRDIHSIVLKIGRQVIEP